SFLLSLIPRPTRSTLFPYTTLFRSRLLHAVDQSEFGISLPRLLDRPRAGERGPDVLADEGEELLVLLRVLNGLCVGLHRKNADGPALVVERHAEPAAVLDRRADGVDLPLFDELPPPAVIEQLRLAGPQHIRRRSPGVALTEHVPLVRIGDVEVDLVGVVGPADELPLPVEERDEEVLGIHQLADDCMDGAIELL